MDKAGSEPQGYLTLQRLILPDPGAEAGLYVHLDAGAALDAGSPAIVFRKGGRAWFDSYMNLFNFGNWGRRCDLRGLVLNLRGQGRFRLRVWLLERPGGAERVLVETGVTLGQGDVRLDLGAHLAPGPDASGMILLRLAAQEDEARFSGGEWLAPLPEAPKDLRLALSITTFRREEAVGRSIARILDFLHGEGAPLMQAAHCKLHLFVVDNGKSVALPPAIADDPALTVIPNANLGGAGGFARGLAAAMDGGFTHCLFMDDDASIQMESLVRTVAFLQLAHSPRAAVAGAMISEANPCAMWENGAVFDRMCRPLHVGTDLREAIPVLWMESAATAPKPQGFYGGWWYFAFPVAAVKHHPFPFFVRGDDISFSLANDFDIATLNGVVSWQEDFSAKESPLTLYLDLRNHLHHHLVHPALEIGPNGTARIVAHFLLRSIVRMHYDSAEAQLAAWEDVMRGPEFFARNADMSKRRPEIASLARSEAWKPVAEGAEIPSAPTEPGLRYSRVMQWLLNGHLVPFWGLIGGRVRVPVTHRGLIWPLWGRKEATFVNHDGTRAYTVRHSKRRGWGLMLRSFKMYLRWRREYAALREAHRKGYEELTRRSFWDQQFRDGQ